MRDFEKDRRTIQDRKDGYVTNEVFLKYADEGWPAALAEIENLKRQLEMAAEEAAKGCCPYDANKAFALICKEDCSDDNDCSERCWLEYWRQKANSNDNAVNSKDKAANSKDSGTFQNGNDHPERKEPGHERV